MKVLALVIVCCLLCFLHLHYLVQASLNEAHSLKDAKFPTSMVVSSSPPLINVSYQAAPELYQWSGNQLKLMGNFSQSTVYNFLGMVIGPEDGLLYVIGHPNKNLNDTIFNVYRFNRSTGSLHETYFIELNSYFPYDQAYPSGIDFGYDGNIYVTFGTQVLRFNAKSGNSMGVFAVPPTSYEFFTEMLFSNTDGLLYMTYISYSNGVFIYNGTTGAYVGTFGTGGYGSSGVSSICQDSNGYIYLPHALDNFACVNAIGGVFRYRPNIDRVPHPFIVTGKGIVPISCSVGTGSMNNTLIVADPCNKRLRLYNLQTGALIGFADTQLSPIIFIEWNDVPTQ